MYLLSKTVQDGTPRDSGNPLSGSEADTSIIRAGEMGGKASALGRTASGPVDAAAAIAKFMGTAGGAAAAPATAAAGTAAKGGKGTAASQLSARGLLDALIGGAGGAAGVAGAAGAAGGASTGVKTAKGTKEAGVAAAAGTGASSGLPTVADDGTITMVFHQVNQDGAGKLTAQLDATSGGTDPAAFQDATVTQNVPGIGIGGLSAASSMDWTVKVRYIFPFHRRFNFRMLTITTRFKCQPAWCAPPQSQALTTSASYACRTPRLPGPLVALRPSHRLLLPRSARSSTTSASATWLAVSSESRSKHLTLITRGVGDWKSRGRTKVGRGLLCNHPEKSSNLERIQELMAMPFFYA